MYAISKGQSKESSKRNKMDKKVIIILISLNGCLNAGYFQYPHLSAQQSPNWLSRLSNSYKRSTANYLAPNNDLSLGADPFTPPINPEHVKEAKDQVRQQIDAYNYSLINPWRKYGFSSSWRRPTRTDQELYDPEYVKPLDNSSSPIDPSISRVDALMEAYNQGRLGRGPKPPRSQDEISVYEQPVDPTYSPSNRGEAYEGAYHLPTPKKQDITLGAKELQAAMNYQEIMHNLQLQEEAKKSWKPRWLPTWLGGGNSKYIEFPKPYLEKTNE